LWGSLFAEPRIFSPAEAYSLSQEAALTSIHVRPIMRLAMRSGPFWLSKMAHSGL
jgi:hypothetical protein